MEKVLIQEENYKGKFVALRSPNDSNVVADGDDPSTVKELALQKGVSEPLIFYVSKSDDEVERIYWIDGNDN
jgi:hypothetical protein